MTWKVTASPAPAGSGRRSILYETAGPGGGTLVVHSPGTVASRRTSSMYIPSRTTLLSVWNLMPNHPVRPTSVFRFTATDFREPLELVLVLVQTRLVMP